MAQLHVGEMTAAAISHHTLHSSSNVERSISPSWLSLSSLSIIIEDCFLLGIDKLFRFVYFLLILIVIIIVDHLSSSSSHAGTDRGRCFCLPDRKMHRVVQLDVPACWNERWNRTSICGYQWRWL